MNREVERHDVVLSHNTTKNLMNLCDKIGTATELKNLEAVFIVWLSNYFRMKTAFLINNI